MNFKKITLCLWIIIIIGGMITYLFFPEKLSFSSLEETTANYPVETPIIYYLLLSFQGVVFIPSPFILVGALIFNPIELFVVNMTGVMTSATIVYYFSRYLECDVHLETKYSEYTHKIKTKLMDKELPLIVGWSFFPMAPTNLIVYIVSSLRINVFKCLLGVFIGESIINAFYIITATMLIKGSLS